MRYIIIPVLLSVTSCGGVDSTDLGKTYSEPPQDDAGDPTSSGGSGGSTNDSDGGDTGGTNAGGDTSSTGGDTAATGGATSAGGTTSSGGTASTGGETSAGGTTSTGGNTGACIPKTCLTLSVEKGWDLCGVVFDGCGNYIDCGGCANPLETCGGAMPVETPSRSGKFVDGVGEPNKCGGGCVAIPGFIPNVDCTTREYCSGEIAPRTSCTNPRHSSSTDFSGIIWCCF